ncbi:alpha/beta fold hydrolase [Demequina subtropica]|uniref:alpha/beta fold hydrolase n=1 Tax=Demequina subtropica TaxID=1638989 RepID=UPI000781C745|nr:alpha/beta hydrolase [Demequina subtropica]
MTSIELTPAERAQVDAANVADGPAVVLVHDLWTLAAIWDPWLEPLAQASLTPVAAAWPREPDSVATALRRPDRLAGVGLGEATGRITALIALLREPPLVVGHCFGGLIAQKLAGRGLARATVAICPAPMKGSIQAPETMLVAAAPVIGDLANRDRAIRFTFPEYRYAWASTVPREEAHELWETTHVPGSGRAVFEVSRSRFERRSPASVDTVNPERGPMLVVGAGHDHLVPPEMAASTFRIQSRNPSPTDFVEFHDRGHSLTHDSRWPEVADRVIDYLARHRRPA